MKIKAPKNPYLFADVKIRGLYGTTLKSWMTNPVSNATRSRPWRVYLGIRGIGQVYSYGICRYRTEATLALAKKVREIVDSPHWRDYKVIRLKESEDTRVSSNSDYNPDVAYRTDIWLQQSGRDIEEWVELKRLRPNLEDEDIGILELETVANRYRRGDEPVATKKVTAFFDKFQWKLVKDFFEGFASLADACESRR